MRTFELCIFLTLVGVKLKIKMQNKLQYTGHYLSLEIITLKFDESARSFVERCFLLVCYKTTKLVISDSVEPTYIVTPVIASTMQLYLK